jgi:hypothetical protein
VNNDRNIARRSNEEVEEVYAYFDPGIIEKVEYTACYVQSDLTNWAKIRSVLLDELYAHDRKKIKWTPRYRTRFGKTDLFQGTKLTEDETMLVKLWEILTGVRPTWEFVKQQDDTAARKKTKK